MPTITKRFASPVLWFLMAVAAIGLFDSIGPPEKTLGTNARVVYLHGVWVWASLLTLLAAGSVGLAALLTRREALHHWSRALGRAGLFFWITYLPISMWAMQTNWNGLFLAEPRWRMAIVFAAGGLALQIGVALMENPTWASAGNLVYIVAMLFALANTENVMHPPAPILHSDARGIQLYFAGLLLLTLLAASQAARWFFSFESNGRFDRASRPLSKPPKVI
jgi:hypothetical protein